MTHSHRFILESTVFLSAVGAALLLATAPNLGARSMPSPATPATVVHNSTVSASQTQSAAKPSLAGQWTLNKDQSDDPREKMQQAMGNNGEGGGGGQHGGGGQRGGGQGRGGGMMNDMSQLTIVQTDTSVKVTGASGRVLAALPPETQASKPRPNSDNDQGGEGEQAERRRYTRPVATWQGSQLVTSAEGPRGGSMNRTYELSSDGKQLIVTTKMQNPRMNQPVSIRFVYDQVKPNSGSGSSPQQ